MNTARQPRPLIAWTLYACVLFNLLACGIAHGQMAGLQLSGLYAIVCLDQGAVGGDLSLAPGALSDSASFSCPLCSGVALGMALLFALAWVPRNTLRLRPFLSANHSPPRYLWPSANPRASPQS
ncbi:DUF2946 domain-containing protein [Pseudomonas sp. HMWF032]|uniref:DUF2946 domain-containing protein n=1 Tax=unclassified Pseudomonas TaxID=196821 RepID=UPI000D33F41B|nr:MULTISPECIES: DUF2946 domain-containing protein [unclassified Pseudomonas]PTS86001.1 DUF2946 domain-containing protein [Pseudomonas sp. HMWF032]PTT83591.1 DUF2946 domain-containing protein [Pseudomonas sp. HMWF010]WAC45480.1 DUF2946 domain-containing protein [Pseudomonas sp. SL4(2022)]